MLGITLKQTRVYQEAKEEGRSEGREVGLEEGKKALILRLLTKRFGQLPEEVRLQISSLPIAAVENLSEALLDFGSLADLQAWLEAQ